MFLCLLGSISNCILDAFFHSTELGGCRLRMKKTQCLPIESHASQIIDKDSRCQAKQEDDEIDLSCFHYGCETFNLSTCVGTMSDQRRRRWANILPALAESYVYLLSHIHMSHLEIWKMMTQFPSQCEKNPSRFCKNISENVLVLHYFHFM